MKAILSLFTACSLLFCPLSALALEGDLVAYNEGYPGSLSTYHEMDQETFELQCNRKIAEDTVVYDYRTNTSAVVPAGTYVIVSDTSGERTGVSFMVDGNFYHGWGEMELEAASSVVRLPNGMASNVHEKDPDYDEKISQGELEFDVHLYSDQQAYYRWKGGLDEEPPRKDAASAPEAAESNDRAPSDESATEAPRTSSASAQRDSSRSASEKKQAASLAFTPAFHQGRTVEIEQMGSYTSQITADGKALEIPSAELFFGNASSVETAVIYAPRTGKCSLRTQPDDEASVLQKCKAGTVVGVVAKGERFSVIHINGKQGYVSNSCLVFHDAERSPQGVAQLAFNGYTNGGTTINIRNGAGKEYHKIAEWRTGTEVLVWGRNDGWVEIESKGIRGYVMDEFLTDVSSFFP